MKIEDSKEVYRFVNAFKEIYTTINSRKIPEFIISSDGEKLFVYFKKQDFFLLKMEFFDFKYGEFLEFLKNKYCEISIENLVKIKNCLKKNVKEIEIDNDDFIFKFIDKETSTDDSVTFARKDLYWEETKQIEDIENSLCFSSSIENENSSIFRIFMDEDGNISTEKIGSKILEFPYEKLAAAVSSNTKLTAKASEKNEDFRFVSVEGSDEEKAVKVYQYFKTI